MYEVASVEVLSGDTATPEGANNARFLERVHEMADLIERQATLLSTASQIIGNAYDAVSESRTDEALLHLGYLSAQLKGTAL